MISSLKLMAEQIYDVTFDLAILCTVNKRLLYNIIMITINKFLVCAND